MNLARVQAQITGLLALPDGWNSHGARRIAPDMAAFALELLTEIAPPDLPDPHVIPTTGGSVQFEWHEAGLDIEIEIEIGSISVIHYRRADQFGQMREGSSAWPFSIPRMILRELAERVTKPLTDTGPVKETGAEL